MRKRLRFLQQYKEKMDPPVQKTPMQYNILWLLRLELVQSFVYLHCS